MGVAYLSMALLGPFEVAVDGNPVTWFQSDKARALLAYLAVEAASPHPRHALAGLLWPESTDAHALRSLSQALCNLRSVLHDHATPAPCFIVTPHTIQFNPQCNHWVDVAEFGRLVNWESGRLVDWYAAAAGRLVRRRESEPSSVNHTTTLPMYQSTNLPILHRAISLYRGPFLDDLALGDAGAFEEWVLIHRERLHRLLMAALCRLAEGHEALGELDQALGCARHQVELEPWHEEGHMQVMRLLARSGRRSEALAQYHLCRRLLASELGVEPAAAITRLYEQIRDCA